MKLIDLKCPNCGAELRIEEGMAKAFCVHCGHQLILDEQRLRADSASFRDAGYQFERGRLQAQAEHAARTRGAPHQPDAGRERRLNRIHRWCLLLAALVVFVTGLLELGRLPAILLSALLIIVAVGDRRIHWLVRLLVIPGMLLVLLTRSVLG